MYSNIRTSVILFSPPNTRRLRYLSLAPINLAAFPSSPDTLALSTKLSQMAEAWRDPREGRRVINRSLEIVLGKINGVHEVQELCRRLRQGKKLLEMNGNSRKVGGSSVVFDLVECAAKGLGNLAKIGRYPLFQSQECQVSFSTLSATCE